MNRNARKDTKFLTALAATGNVGEAARKAGYGRSQVCKARDEDGDFRAAWNEAMETATDVLEAEARRRAMGGIDDAPRGGGEGGVARRYSDTLLMFLLKTYRPETFKERGEIEHKGSVDLVARLNRARERVRQRSEN